MRQYCFLATGETYVTGQGKFASVTGRAPSDGRDRHNRGTAQAHEHVVERPQPTRPRRQARRVLRSRQEVVVSHKNPATSLSKKTTLTSSFVSSAVMISLSCGIVSGPKMLRGG